MEPNSPESTPSSGADPKLPHSWETGHDVRFYRRPQSLTRAVVEFLAEGICRGQPSVVIATAANRKAFDEGLRALDIDIRELVVGRDIVWLDAQQTLAAFMEGNRVSPELFEATIGGIFRSLSAGREYVISRVYGEMVDLLMRAGHATAAIELEDMWNSLGERFGFWLLCAYAENSLAPHLASPRRAICDRHRHTADLDALRGETVDAVNAAFRRASNANCSRPNEEVFDALRRLVDECKAAGDSPERVIIEAKRLAESCGWTPRYGGKEWHHGNTVHALRDIASMCVAHYFMPVEKS